MPRTPLSALSSFTSRHKMHVAHRMLRTSIVVSRRMFVRISNPSLSHDKASNCRLECRRSLGPSSSKPWTQRMVCKSSSGGGDGGSGPGSKVSTGGSDGDNSQGPGFGLWAKYLEWLQKAPLLTRSITCAILNAVGDAFSQLVIEKGELNARRLSTFSLLGFCFVGPVLHFWYSLLGSLVPFGGLQGILTSLALDQLVFAPLFIGSIMSLLTAVEGGGTTSVRNKLQQDLFPAIKVNWLLWVPAQYINFKFVPPHLRVLAVNITALIWNVYMSYTSHKAVASHA